MAFTIIADKAKKAEIDIELKLHINQQLFNKGHISKYMYEQAKEMIYKQAGETKCH